MNNTFDSLFNLLCRHQVASLLLLTSALALLLWLALLRPQRVELYALREELQVLEQTRQHLRVQSGSLPDEPELRAQLDELTLRSSSSGGSLENILVARGAQLEQWQPDAQPRTLTLKMGWQQFQPLFAELTADTFAFPAAFLLEAQQGLLRAQLWLEDEDVS